MVTVIPMIVSAVGAGQAVQQLAQLLLDVDPKLSKWNSRCHDMFYLYIIQHWKFTSFINKIIHSLNITGETTWCFRFGGWNQKLLLRGQYAALERAVPKLRNLGPGQEQEWKTTLSRRRLHRVPEETGDLSEYQADYSIKDKTQSS